MNRFRKITAVVLTTLLLIIPMNERLDASASFALEQISQAYVIQNGSLIELNSSTQIAYGSTIQLNFQIRNRSSVIDTYIGFETKYGITFHSYYSGVLVINGVSATQEQYQNFINNTGVSLSLGNDYTNIQLQVKSIGASRDKITGNLRVYAPNISSSIKTNTTEHVFYGTFNEASYYNVKFYSNDDLLSSTTVLSGDTVTIPNVEEPYGYQFVGFNTLQDGNGTYYSQEPIFSNMSYYAVFKKKVFTVNYYIDENLYYSEQVPFGEDAEGIKIDDTSEKKFLKWDKSLNNITDNINVFAVFEDIDKQDEKENSLKISEKSSKQGSGKLISDKTYHWSADDINEDENNKSEDESITIYVEEKGNIALLPILTVLSILLIIFVWKKMNQSSNKFI